MITSRFIRTYAMFFFAFTWLFMAFTMFFFAFTWLFMAFTMFFFAFTMFFFAFTMFLFAFTYFSMAFTRKIKINRRFQIKFIVNPCFTNQFINQFHFTSDCLHLILCFFKSLAWTITLFLKKRPILNLVKLFTPLSKTNNS